MRRCSNGTLLKWDALSAVFLRQIGLYVFLMLLIPLQSLAKTINYSYPTSVPSYSLSVGQTQSISGIELGYNETYSTSQAAAAVKLYEVSVPSNSRLDIYVTYAYANSTHKIVAEIFNSNPKLNYSTPIWSGTCSTAVTSFDLSALLGSVGATYATTYWLRLTYVAEGTTGNQVATGVGLQLSCVSNAPSVDAPANDSFSSPTTISGVSGSKVGSNTGATLQSSEVMPRAQNSSTGSVWYKWTAPSSGTATFDTIGSEFDTVLGIYTGTSVSALTEIDSNDDIESGNTKSRVTFTANSGTTYRIAVYGYNGKNGSFTLNWSLTSGGSSSGNTKYALCVGLNDYDMTSWHSAGWSLSVLNGCVNDATYFRNNLVNRGGWSSANVTKLTDSGATKAAIRKAITNYAAKAVSGDTFIFQHSSHGLSDPDTSGNYTKDVALAAYAGPYWDFELASDLGQFASGVKVVVVVDTCHSGGLFKGMEKIDANGLSFDIASRVSALIDNQRDNEAKSGNKAATKGILSSEIGWATAAEYDKVSSDGACYDSMAWMTDWSKNWFNCGGDVCGGAFTAALTWGWWTGTADANGNGAMDVYEGFRYAETVLANIGKNPPKCLNEGVLRSVALGANGGYPTSPTMIINDYAANGNPSSITLSWSGAQNATSFNIYRSTTASPRPSSPYKTGATSPYTDSASLIQGRRYYYWIEAKNSSGSAFSAPDWGNTIIPLATVLDNSTLSFTTGGDASWWGQSDVSHDGTDSARTGMIGNSKDSWLQTTISGAGTLVFWWKSSCEDDNGWYDYLEVLVDGTQKQRIKGETDWTQVSLSITGSGNHTIKWNYHKDDTNYDGSDCGWVDQVTWTPSAPATQSVTFNANGGSCSVSKATYTIGGTYASPSLPTASRTGYSFAGWWTSSSGGTQITASSTVSSSTSRTLYAHWTPNSYNVSYALDGGAHGAMHPSTATYDTAFYISAPTKSGYAFTGWTVTSGLNTSTAKWGTTSSPSTSLTSTTTKCVNGVTGNVYFKNLRSTSGSVTLTANWTETPTATLPTALDNTTLSFTTGGSSSWIGQTTITHDGIDAARSGALDNNQTNWLQTTVSGPGTISFWWYVSSEANYDYLEFLVDGSVVWSLSGTNNVWTSKSHTISTSGTHTLQWRYRKDVSQYRGEDAGFVDQVTWTPTYAVSYKPGSYASGSTYTATKTNDVALVLRGSTYSRTGYTQSGWSTSVSGTSKSYNLSASYTANAAITLYPYWTANTYSVTYSLNGGTHGATHPTSATYDTAFYVSAPSKTGYTFAGWTVTSGLNTSTAKWGTTSSPSTSLTSTSTKCVNGTTGNVYFKNLRSVTGSVTLTANWQCNHSNTAIQNARAATCTVAGYTGDRVCSTCGTVVETGTTILALGHQEGAGVVTQEPTATAEGVMTYSCTRCGIVMRTEAIPMLVATCPDLRFVTFQDWNFGYAVFTVTNSEGGGVFNSAPVRLFDRYELFGVVYGYANTGDAAISNATVTTKYEMIDEVGMSTQAVSTATLSLEPGWGSQSAMFATSWTNLAAGVYTARVTLDAANALPDTNRVNNVSEFVFAIRDPLALGTALGCNDLAFETNGDDWYGTRDGTDQTVSYARTKHLGNYGTNVLSATVSGAGTLSFDWKVSSELNYDWLEFLIDGVVTNRISGTNCVWQSRSYEFTDGGHVVEWRYRKDESYYAGLDCAWLANVEWTASALPGSPSYLVIDLSGGPNALFYPVEVANSIPSGGFNTDEYKTTKLVLRKIPAGTFTMGCSDGKVGYSGTEAVPHSVTISAPYYMGVFEVTQRQYELVMGRRPSYFNNVDCYATRPVEQVARNDIRGNSSFYDWPGSADVDPVSFMGRLRAKTGIDSFDLPTEAKWEHACRAGTTTAFNNGVNPGSTSPEDTTMNSLGRYNGGLAFGNERPIPDRVSTTGDGTAAVGSYEPNAWGLYDMHGNVWEFCLDWYQGRNTFSSSAVVNPAGPVSGTGIVRRGGGWYDYAATCSSAYRGDCAPSYWDANIGFRLSCSADVDAATGIEVDVGDDKTVTVPRAWINQYPTLVSAVGGNADSAVRNGTAANGRKVWECYALGLDPTLATNDFRIVSIEFVDGKPKVEWEPKTNRWTGAEIQAVLKGAESLDGE